MVKKETVITVDASQAGTGKVTCRIRDSNGHDIDIDIIENPDETFSIQFTPQFPGTYSISIQFGGQSIPDGKYQVEVSFLAFAYCSNMLYKLGGFIWVDVVSGDIAFSSQKYSQLFLKEILLLLVSMILMSTFPCLNG